MQLLIIGNPENRRVVGFAQAAAAGGLSTRIIAHEELVSEPDRLCELPDVPTTLVRIDSAGENARVETMLLGQGYQDVLEYGAHAISPDELAAREPLRGEVLCPRQYHLGFTRYMKRLESIFAARPAWRILNPPESILRMFNKNDSMETYRRMGISVPPSLPNISTPDELRTSMADRGIHSVYVKLTCGSSASCLGVFSWRRGNRPSLMTTLRKTDSGYFNSLRIQRIDDTDHVESVLAFLLREGCRVEESMPKSRRDSAFMDCRVLVIDGRACFQVVRESPHPITNLHLGGRRGDLASLRNRIGEQAWGEALLQAEKVWSAHDCFHVGVDLMFDPGFSRSTIIESNAFGDLLPGLQYQGRSVYEHQVEVLKRKYSSHGA